MMKRIQLHPVKSWIKKEKKYLKKSTKNSLRQVNMFLDWMKRLKKERDKIKHLKEQTLRRTQKGK